MAFDYTIFELALSNFDFGVGGALIPIILILVSTIIITRDTRNMRLLLFPLAVGFYQIGLFGGVKYVPYTIIAFTAVVWIVTLTGAHIIGSTLAGAGEAMARATGTITRTPYNIGKWRVKKHKESDSYKINKKLNELNQKYRIKEKTSRQEFINKLQEKNINSSFLYPRKDPMRTKETSLEWPNIETLKYEK